MLGFLTGVVLNACVACTPGLPAAGLVPDTPPAVESVRHRRSHFVQTRRAYRHCRAKWGRRLIAAYESSNRWKCIYRTRGYRR